MQKSRGAWQQHMQTQSRAKGMKEIVYQIMAIHWTCGGRARGGTVAPCGRAGAAGTSGETLRPREDAHDDDAQAPIGGNALVVAAEYGHDDGE